MIYRAPSPEDPLDQGDITDGCPLVYVSRFDPENLTSLKTEHTLHRVVVLTQACDLAQGKVADVLVSVLLDAQGLVAQGLLKPADVRGPIRGGRVYGWYFLPKSAEHGLPEPYPTE
jgi:hypothetical protein